MRIRFLILAVVSMIATMGASSAWAGDGAIQLLRTAAEGGIADAQYELAQRLESGDGMKKDLAEAQRWYQEAAKGGSAQAKLWIKNLEISEKKAREEALKKKRLLEIQENELKLERQRAEQERLKLEQLAEEQRQQQQANEEMLREQQRKALNPYSDDPLVSATLEDARKLEVFAATALDVLKQDQLTLIDLKKQLDSSLIDSDKAQQVLNQASANVKYLENSLLHLGNRLRELDDSVESSDADGEKRQLLVSTISKMKQQLSSLEDQTQKVNDQCKSIKKTL